MYKNLKLIWSSAYSALITGLAVVAVTIYMEYSPVFKVILTNLTSHHWISKSLGSIILYFILFFIFNKIGGDNKSEFQVRRALWTLFIFTILSALAIFVFFVWHYLAT